MNLKETLLNISGVFTNTGKINPNIYKNDDVVRLLSDIPGNNLSEQIYLIMNDLSEIPICPVCDIIPLKFSSYKKGYSQYCGRSCSAKSLDKASKREATCVERYGEDYQEKRVAKSKTTHKQRTGYEHNMQDPDHLKAREAQYLEKTGYNHPSQNPSINHNRDVSSWNSTESKEKIRQTNLERYGCENPLGSDTVQDKIKAAKLSSGVNKGDTFANLDDTIDYTNYTVREIGDMLGVSRTCTGVHLRRLGIETIGPGYESSQERDIKKFLTDLGVVYRKDRSVLPGNKELDIYIPSHNLAIECNGVYWHSESQGKDKKYHLSKTNECEQQGIQLLHIFDVEWNNPVQREIWKSMIRSRLGMNNRIYARKCDIREVVMEEAKTFLSDNHLAGFKGGSIKLGLYHNNTLVQMIVVGKPRFNKHYEWELIRAATETGVTVVGGLSRLMKHINGSIISYADRRYSTGKGYDAIGMESLLSSSPNYFYIIKGRLENRMRYQKAKLEKQLDVFDPNLSEIENMRANGFDRIWDCGNLVYVKNVS